MANLGDVGESFGVTVATFCRGAFTIDKQPQFVDVSVPGATPNNRMQLFTQAGTYVDRVNVNSSGVGKFYDLDDGGYTAYEVGTGNAWSITVVGTVVTVTQIASSGTPVLIFAA